MKKVSIIVISSVFILGIGSISYIYLHHGLNTITHKSNMNIFFHKNNSSQLHTMEFLSGRSEIIGSGKETRQNSFNKFQKIASQKHIYLNTLEKKLQNIIKLAEKVDYDTTQLYYYESELEILKNQYHNARSEKHMHSNDFYSKRKKRHETNLAMRSIGTGIQNEFIQLKQYLQTHFLEK